jgi:2-methylcitrate dehydratase PrpD
MNETATKDTIYILANHVVNTRYEDLPPEAIEAARRLILDGFAVGLGGADKEGVNGLLDLLRDWGGKPESTVWTFGDRLPAAAAAQINAMMMHALDYDDVYDKTVLHCGVVAIPVALAMAERLGGVSGKDFITAVTLGSDICSRLSLAVTIPVFELGWHYTTLHGNFNGAAVAGKLLALDQEKMVSAFGLAYHQAGGNYQGLHDGVLAKRIGPGFASRDGITAALLAQRGVTGPRNVIDGKAGLYKVYHRGNFSPDILLKDLGKLFEVVNLSLKPYPCCRGTHPSIDGALALAKEHNLKPEDVEDVKIYIGKGIYYLVCDPVEAKQNPKTVVDAQFSIPWVVAWALNYRKVGLGPFTPQAIGNKEVLALSNKVTPVIDNSLHTIGLDPAIVEVTMRDGSKYNRRIDVAYGSPDRQMTIEDIREKMLDCVQLSAKPLTEERIGRLTDMVMSLEKVSDVKELVKLLTS